MSLEIDRLIEPGGVQRHGGPRAYQGRRLSPTAAALLLALSPGRAAAQGVAPPPMVAGDPSEVVIRAPGGGSRQDASTRAITVVSQEEARAAAPQSLADALRYQGSVAVQQTTPGQSTVYVRGLSGREVVHLVDGVRVNSTIFRAGNNPYLALIDPYGLSRVEVVRGASSTLHGSDALAGVVAGFTRLPGYSVGSTVTRATAYQSFTTNALGSASRVALEHSDRGWSAHLGLTYYGASDIRPGEGERSPVPSSWAGLSRAPGGAYAPALSVYERGTAFSAYAGDGVFRFKPAPGFDVALRAQAALRPELVRYDEVSPRFKREYPSSAESALRPLARLVASATVSHRSRAAPYEQLLVTLSWQRLSESLRRRPLDEICSVEGSGPCQGELRLSPSARLRREENRADAVGLRAETRWALLRKELGLIGGVELLRERVSSEASSIRSDQAQITDDAPRYPDGSSQTQLGVFAQADWKVTRSLSVALGGRGSLFALDIEGRSGAAETPALSTSTLDGTFSAGARWAFLPRLAWVVNAGRGVRAPNIQDFASLGPRAGDRFQVPSSDVRPESSLSVDTGFKASFREVFGEIFVFALRYRDALVLVPTTVEGAAQSPEGLSYVKTSNASRVDTYGVEGALSWAFAERWSLFVRGIAMRGEQRNDAATGLPASTPADRIPPYTVTSGLRYDPVHMLRFDFFVHARARQDRLNDPTNTDDNRIPEGGTPGYATLHAAMRIRATPRVDLRLAADNIADSLVLDHGSGFYRAGRSFSGALSLKID